THRLGVNMRIPRAAILVVTCITIGAAGSLAAAPRPLSKVLVWVLSRDAETAHDVEMKILDALANHGVAGISIRDALPHGIPASSREAIRRMRETGCQSLLVLHRRPSIQLERASAKTATLSRLLGAVPDILNPANEMDSEVTVPVDVARPVDQSFQNVHGNLDILKGKAEVFSLATGKRIWFGDSHVKTSENLPTSLFHERIAKTVAATLEQAHLIPPDRKASSLSDMIR
ncbi:MAG TPA: hypothetical protein VMU17_04530, partial [Elusimicrobiota bacterium]|nr:hypothetical protein [Elusimicrobiota bacterium]